MGYSTIALTSLLLLTVSTQALDYDSRETICVGSRCYKPSYTRPNNISPCAVGSAICPDHPQESYIPSQGAIRPASVPAQSSRVQDWCNVRKCGTLHTMCIYRYPGPAPSCQDLGGGLSATDKATIVNKHNELRQQVARGEERRGLYNRPQPRAKFGRLPNIQWDDTLAEIAQRWADQCQRRHDKCSNVPEYIVSQNLASYWDRYEPNRLSDYTLEDLILTWYNEVEHFDPDDVRAYKGPTSRDGERVGHYANMVSESVTKIGCGLRLFRENGLNWKHLVCNYGPAGLYENEPIYQTY